MSSSDRRWPSPIPKIGSVPMEIILPQPTFQQREKLRMGNAESRLYQILELETRDLVPVPIQIPTSTPPRYLAWMMESHKPFSNRACHKLLAQSALLKIRRSFIPQVNGPGEDLLASQMKLIGPESATPQEMEKQLT